MKTRGLSLALSLALVVGLLLAAAPGAVTAAPGVTCESKGRSIAKVMSLSTIVGVDYLGPEVTGIKVTGHWDGQSFYDCVQESARGDLKTWRVGKGTNIDPAA